MGISNHKDLFADGLIGVVVNSCRVDRNAIVIVCRAELLDHLHCASVVVQPRQELIYATGVGEHVIHAVAIRIFRALQGTIGLAEHKHPVFFDQVGLLS